MPNSSSTSKAQSTPAIACATTLERTILQRVTVEAADRAALERRVRELMEELELAATIGARPDVLESFDLEKSSTPRGAEGVVYPVWFGTNRKPDAGGGFTGERHDRVTLGHVEVFVPEAHRFGETGNAFWRRLLRFDLRNDRLRVQRVSTRIETAFYSEIHQAMQAARESGETTACAGLPARIQRHLCQRGDPRRRSAST